MYKNSVSVIGLGYVGLPTACVLANAGYFVYGIDINENVINNIKSLNCSNLEPAIKDLLNQAIKSDSIQFSTETIASDVYIITVPTPLQADLKPDISYVNNAIDSIIPHLTRGNLILLESTCPIGTTDLIDKKLKTICSGVYIAYCPERILPGNSIHELLYNNRVIGGVNKESNLHAVEFYKTFSHGKISLTDARTAEAAKLAENTYRDINIAYANELSIIVDKLDINISELIALANEHSRVNILEPGIGVGGHCIAVDPHFLIFSAPDSCSLIETARKVNDLKTDWIIKKIKKNAKQDNIQTIACLGLTYKANVSDVRNSPALKIVKLLEKEFIVFKVDPYVKDSLSLEEAIGKAEMFITLVAHDQFLDISDQLPRNCIYLDFTGKCR